MRYNHCEECNCDLLCPYTKREYEDLILHAAYVIADLNKEIIGLKYALKDKYPEIMDDIYLDIDETIENNDLFISSGVRNSQPIRLSHCVTCCSTGFSSESLDIFIVFLI